MTKENVIKLIAYATQGNKTDFAVRVGCSLDTIKNAARAGTNSAALLADILRAIPELSARWLLTGEGEMVRSFGLAYVEQTMWRNIAELAKLAAAVPKMDADQLHRYQYAIANGTFPKFSPDEIATLTAR